MSNIIDLITEYQQLNLSEIIDYDKFNQYAIVHHSSTIEGSTLSEVETQLLLDEQVTPKGKPLEHSLMVKDHYAALQFILHESKNKKPVSVDLITQANAAVMKSTGKVYHTVLGDIDSSKGEFRKGNVSAGGSYFVSYDKVISYTKDLVQAINEKISGSNDLADQLNISFDAHFDLVTIHPFYDGNGRTSRLLMNYIQCLFDLPLAIVYKEDKAYYYEALIETRKNEDLSIFRTFMTQQYSKFLSEEIAKHQDLTKRNKKGRGYSFIF